MAGCILAAGHSPGRARRAPAQRHTLFPGNGYKTSALHPELDFAESQVRTVEGAHIRDLLFYNDGNPGRRAPHPPRPRTTLHLQDDRPWAAALLAAFDRLDTLPADG